MRVIKFRAWDKQEKRMIKNVVVFSDGSFGEQGKDALNIKPIVDGVLLQFTGLLDENGKEVFEGDICYRKRPGTFFGDPDIEDKFVVTWGKKECGFCCGNETTSIRYAIIDNPTPYSVIGNIYETPTLLKSKGAI